MNQKLLFITLCLLGTSMLASAQVELSLQGAIEMPLGSIKDVYKNGSSAAITVSKIKTNQRTRTAWGGSFGYSNFAPAGVSYYSITSSVNGDGNQNGYIKYDNMQAYQLSAQFRRDFIVKKKLEFFYGAELGISYMNSGYERNDPYFSTDYHNFSVRYVFAPKAGINFQFAENLGVFLQTKYAMNLGSADLYGKRLYTFSANSIGLNYRF